VNDSSELHLTQAIAPPAKEQPAQPGGRLGLLIWILIALTVACGVAAFGLWPVQTDSRAHTTTGRHPSSSLPVASGERAISLMA
jgi:hypothetical protein